MCRGPPTLAGGFLYHHTGERFYTSAAITMLESGDAFTPRRLDGTIALKKSILTYWAIAASYLLFGIGVFTSRLPAVLTGVLVILITHRVTIGLTGNRDRAFLAALITFSGVRARTAPRAGLASSQRFRDLS